jgi:catalase
MSNEKKLTSNVGAPVADNQNVMTAGARAAAAARCLVPGEAGPL